MNTKSVALLYHTLTEADMQTAAGGPFISLLQHIYLVLCMFSRPDLMEGLGQNGNLDDAGRHHGKRLPDAHSGACDQVFVVNAGLAGELP